MGLRMNCNQAECPARYTCSNTNEAEPDLIAFILHFAGFPKFAGDAPARSEMISCRWE